MKFQLVIADASPELLARLVAFLDSERVAVSGEAPAIPPVPGVLAPADNPEAGATYPSGSVNEGPSAEAAFGGNAVPPVPAPIVAAPVGSPVPPVPAPGASAPPAASTFVNGVEVDARGLPWDARIHAKSSNGPGGVKNADGTWRAKRGLNDATLVKRIEGELLATLAAPGAGQVAPPPIAPPAPLVPSSAVVAPPIPTMPPAAPAPSAPAPVVPPAPPAASPAVGGTLQPTSNYVELVQQITSAVAAGKLVEAEVVESCNAFGVQSLPLLATRLDLVQSVSARVNAYIAQRG